MPHPVVLPIVWLEQFIGLPALSMSPGLVGLISTAATAAGITLVVGWRVAVKFVFPFFREFFTVRTPSNVTVVNGAGTLGSRIDDLGTQLSQLRDGLGRREEEITLVRKDARADVAEVKDDVKEVKTELRGLISMYHENAATAKENARTAAEEREAMRLSQKDIHGAIVGITRRLDALAGDSQ